MIPKEIKEDLYFILRLFTIHLPQFQPSTNSKLGRVVEYIESIPDLPQPDWKEAPEWAEWAILDINIAETYSFIWIYSDLEPTLNDLYYQFPGRFQLGKCIPLELGIDYRKVKFNKSDCYE